ncbi:MAG TPA: MarR family transcriptional regulator [Clostridiaceae bacterium]|nr:MarR family transcriptional regulator [Clostridiaceae bacterium]
MSHNDLRLECHSELMKLAWKIIRKSRQNLSELGFTWGQYNIMKNIMPGESITLSELSSRALKENSNVTPLVDYLEEKGIIMRANDPQDRRITRVRLTENGKNIREMAISSHQEFIKEVFKYVPYEDMERFLEIIKVFQTYIMP